MEIYSLVRSVGPRRCARPWLRSAAAFTAIILIGGCTSPDGVAATGIDGAAATGIAEMRAPPAGSIFPAARAIEARLVNDPSYAGAVIRDAPTPEAIFALTKDAETKVRELTASEGKCGPWPHPAARPGAKTFAENTFLVNFAQECSGTPARGRRSGGR